MTAEPTTDPLDAHLRSFLATKFPDATVTELRVLEGGHSGHTLLATLHDDSGDTTEAASDGVATTSTEEYVVLKAGAPGRPATGRHDVLRQARVLSVVSAAADVAVPAVLASEAGDPPIFAMAFAPGDAIEPVLDGVDGLTASRVEARARGAARMLGALHRVDPAPLAEPVSHIADELERWSRTMAAVDQTLVVGADRLMAALAASIPEELPPAVVHGDYRLGNMLCDGDDPVAIIDWEIWSVTDPRIDLGWMLLFCDDTEFPEVGFAAPGMPSASELVTEYSTVVGEVPEWEWFLAFARMKMAAIMGHNLRRHREGRYNDPYQERLPPTIASMVSRGLAQFDPTGTP